MNSYPIYLLSAKNGAIQVVFPDGKEDIGHSEFWENTVSHIVANYYHIPQIKLANLPYCQHRARIVDDKCYYGENHDPNLLKQIRQATGNNKLIFIYDDHEKRLKADVLEFRKLVRNYRPKSTIT